ncbi:N-acyltransferase [Bodo saltans virus]|jgi:GNAT superfamily N-acetyltransferase|uniref:N-acyltransferase n=1 Tax=Bodo saltans virus TaxID=2024608 RepID=A0A2H4UUC7_9VIRU|nr:N-acyltransferase [Bodo saltans virus]ATZ80474.1 N-acyltransferase [Bodo saltans virus]
MHIYIAKDIKKTESIKLANVIYNNFIELSKYEQLSHTKPELERLITSPESLILLMIVNKKIAGYMIGEIKSLNDGRVVFYISYIFTSKLFRGKGIASKLMSHVEKYSKKNNCNGILLTCDTEDDYVNNFYLMKGFMPDMVLRRYDKYDVLYKSL